jgi:ESS family glutamate:Na+ symporter
VETPAPILLDPLQTVTAGLLVYLAGAALTRRFAILRRLNIPEPVTGGLLAALGTLAVFVLSGAEIRFDLVRRDYLLLVFFAGVGLNARLADLARGGRPLLLLLALTLGFIALQNAAGLALVTAAGLPAGISVLFGSAALVGGHGTVIAWTPEVARVTAMPGTAEIGIAMATLGLVAAALVGGPIAGVLIRRHGLRSTHAGEAQAVGVDYGDEADTSISALSLIRGLAWIHGAMLLGGVLDGLLARTGLDLPDFVPTMFAAILLANLVPLLLPRLPQVRATPTLAVLTDFALGAFLAMSLMALQLWTIAGLGALLAAVMVAQTLLVALFCLFVLFPVMGRDYDAAVLAAGFGGFALGATPTAIANMTAVTKAHGPSPLAFVILPLISAFFVDLANAVAIRFFLSL